MTATAIPKSPYSTRQVLTKIRQYFSRPNARYAIEKIQVGGLTCQYRAPDGSKCAVGVLIPDELYSRAMEQWEPEEVGNFLKSKGILKENVPDSLLRDLQSHHDEEAMAGSPMSLFIEDIARLEKEYIS